MEVLLEGIASLLVHISNKDVAAEDIWYLTPRQHAIELLIFNAILAVLFFIIIRNGRGPEANEQRSKQLSKKNEEEKRQVLDWPLYIMRFILTGCFFITIIHKVNGQKISNMLMPCHVTTAFYLFSLYTPNKKHATFVFNISVHFMFFTWLAIAVPDKRGLFQFLEIPNFWVHHWVLFFIPFYILWTGFYPIDHTNHYYYKLAVCIGMFIHVNVMAIAAMMSGLNVGYMLLPPPKTPLGRNAWFRWTHSGFLIVMGWICGYPIPALINKIHNLMRRDATKKKI